MSEYINLSTLVKSVKSNFWYLKSIVCNKSENYCDIKDIKYITIFQFTTEKTELNEKSDICFKVINIYLNNSFQSDTQKFTYKIHNFFSEYTKNTTILSNKDLFREKILDKIPNESYPIINVYLSPNEILFESLNKTFFYVEDENGIKNLPKKQVGLWSSTDNKVIKVDSNENEERIYESLRVSFNSWKFYDISHPNQDYYKFKDMKIISYSVIDNDDSDEFISELDKVEKIAD